MCLQHSRSASVISWAELTQAIAGYPHITARRTRPTSLRAIFTPTVFYKTPQELRCDAGHERRAWSAKQHARRTLDSVSEALAKIARLALANSTQTARGTA